MTFIHPLRTCVSLNSERTVGDTFLSSRDGSQGARSTESENMTSSGKARMGLPVRMSLQVLSGLSMRKNYCIIELSSMPMCITMMKMSDRKQI